jgi:uncharacterized protein (TIGR01319 family)
MLLIDIGSTFTKLVVIDTESRQIVRSTCSPTTLSDVSVGFSNGLQQLKASAVSEALLEEKYASSSAAGGLRMVAVGLVPDLTVEAAKRAALGAGAKVISTYSFALTDDHIRKIRGIDPDLLLLAGGTDGGDKKTIIHNARKIGNSDIGCPVIVAGNREAVDPIQKYFDHSKKTVYFADNVMPSLDKINVDSVKEIIREIFIKHIIHAKGLDKINRFIDSIVFPTPLAVLEAAKTIAGVVDSGVVIVDVGGATTDVHSITEGLPHDPQIVLKGLPEPFAKRTVEGDIGVRHNISSIVELVGKDRFLTDIQRSDHFDTDRLEQLTTLWSNDTSALPLNGIEAAFDLALSISAVEIAINRHAGSLEALWTPMGKTLVQYGKDLTDIHTVIGTGGPIINSKNPKAVLEKVVFDPKNPFTLKPRHPKMYIDSNYVLFSIGLISQVLPQASEDIAANCLNHMEVL